MLERYTGSFLLAAAMTFGLFFAMQALVATGHNAIIDNPPMTDVNLRPVIEDTPVETIKPKPIHKQEVLKPPPTRHLPPAPTGPTKTALHGALPPVVKEKGPEIRVPDDGDVVPLVRVQPIYPQIALRNGIEGYVIMAFDITREGRVKNMTVVEAQPQGIFESAATKALSQFRYKQRMLDGQAVERQNARFQFTFSLDK